MKSKLTTVILAISVTLNILFAVLYLKSGKSDSNPGVPNSSPEAAAAGAPVNPTPVASERPPESGGSWFGGGSSDLKAGIERNLVPGILKVLSRRIAGITVKGVDVEDDKYILIVDAGGLTSTVQLAEIRHIVTGAMTNYANQNPKLKGRQPEVQITNAAPATGN